MEGVKDFNGTLMCIWKKDETYIERRIRLPKYESLFINQPLPDPDVVILFINKLIISKKAESNNKSCGFSCRV